MLCRATKVILVLLIISIVCMPVSLVFGTGIAIITAILGLAYILEDK